MKTRRQAVGFSLPMVFTLSLAILIIISALLAATSVSYKGQFVDHYQKLADEAAEAGTAYATACLILSSHAQTWGPAAGNPSLAPQTDCTGAPITAAPIPSKYIYSDSLVRSYFIVGNLDYSAQFGAQVSSQGYVELLSPSGTVTKTYTSILKKVLTWPTDVAAQASSSGSRRTCAIVNYQVYCWGLNRYGELGDGHSIGTGNIGDPSDADSLVPVKVRQDPGVMAGKKIAKIVVAQYQTCAISTDSNLYCWGYNNVGQLGDGTTNYSDVPLLIGGPDKTTGPLAGKTITDAGASNSATCAITGGKIYCWGTNINGVTGLGVTSGYTLLPTQVSATNTGTTLPTSYIASSLSTSGSRSYDMCAISSGKAYCWGDNTVGTIGDGTTTDRSVPTAVYTGGALAGKTVTTISQDGYYNTYPNYGWPHVCALASGNVYCWGENKNGQLGNNSTTDSTVPVAVISSGVLSGKTITDVKVGLNHSCALADGGVYCWGTDGSGQVGDNSSVDKKTPVAVAQQPGNLTASNVVSLGAGSNRGCAVITDGRTFCWGYNADGQIGDGTQINRHVPTESLFLRPSGNQYIF